MMHAPSAADILDRLSPKEIETRLEELDRETRALRVLLRAARLRHSDQRAVADAMREQRRVGVEATIASSGQDCRRASGESENA